MKKLLAVLTVVAACSGLTTNSFATDKDIEFLYIQSAKSATIKSAKEPHDSFTLTLKNVQPHVVCFSDRPKRIAQTMTTREFIQEWTHPSPENKDSFKDDAPNADLNGVNVATHEQVNIPLELSNPQYDENGNTLTYTVNQLQGGSKISPMKLRYATLVIDRCTRCRPI